LFLNSWIFKRGALAFTSPIFPSAFIDSKRTLISGSSKELIRGSVAPLSPILPRASADLHRTL